MADGTNNASPILLTGDGRRYPLSREERQFMALSDAGVLYVNEQHRSHIRVVTFMDTLGRDGVQFTVTPVPLTQLIHMYRDQVAVRVHENRVQEWVTSRIQTIRADGGSDLHLVLNNDVMKVAYRVHGELVNLPEENREDGREIIAGIYQGMCDVAEAQFKWHHSQDARMSESWVRQWGLYGARVATRPTDAGMMMIIRLLYDSGVTAVDPLGLGFLPEQAAQLHELVERSSGITIVSGPTGSGKSTTLKVLLAMMSARFAGRKHILTIEDPPEYRVQGVNQTPVTGISDRSDEVEVSRAWSRAISNAMRLDPDVIMVGEIRDHSTAVAAFRAAMTGHNVLTTLHANDVISNMDRLADIGVEHSLMTDPALVGGLVFQRLAPELCPHCKVPYSKAVKALDKGLVGRVSRLLDGDRLFTRGAGCKHCKKRGIVGRVPIAEIVLPDQEFMRRFRSKSGKAGARAYWISDLAGVTRCQHLLQRIQDGSVDPQMGEFFVCRLDEDLKHGGTAHV